MDFKDALKNHILNHKNLKVEDILKFTYQASFGMEHLVLDISLAKEYFEKEYENTVSLDIPLYEDLNENYIRINLAKWKYLRLDKDWLYNIFINSKCEGIEDFKENLKIARNIILELNIFSSINLWDDYITKYLEEGIHPIHHSESYRKEYIPSYRVCNKKYLKVIPILEKINSDNFIITIDGRAASGKTYLASLLEDTLNVNSIKMDHFFLPNDLRTPSRFNEIGGNVDYDRFILEVLPNLRHNKSFKYNIFDCKTKKLNGVNTIKGDRIKIIEGTYSNHIKFGNYSNLKIFLTIDYETQLNRILKRNGEFMLNRFINEWIPLEEKYFSSLNLEEFLLL